MTAVALLGAGRMGQDPISVTVHRSSIVDPEIGRLGDVDTASATLVAQDGTITTILNSRRCAFGFDQRVEAFGSDGMVMSDNPRQSGFRRYMPVGAYDGLMATYLAGAATASQNHGKTIHLTGINQEFGDV